MGRPAETWSRHLDFVGTDFIQLHFGQTFSDIFLLFSLKFYSTPFRPKLFSHIFVVIIKFWTNFNPKKQQMYIYLSRMDNNLGF
jgi:hypothetical protein